MTSAPAAPWLVASLCLWCAAPVIAQDTRADQIAHAQSEKAKQVKPYQPTKAERMASQAKKLVELPNGFYPWFDSVYGGGGFTLGVGYRRYVGDRSTWTARTLLSAKLYKLAEVATDSPGLANGRVDLHTAFGWRDATQVNFFGVGGDTSDDRANFGMQQAYAGGLATFRPWKTGLVDLGVQYEGYLLKGGAGSTPSIEEQYTAETVPGLGDSPNFLHLTIAGGADTRPAKGYARRGGRYAMTYDAFFDRNHTYTFDRLQAEVIQHIPILRETWVLSLHGVAKTTLHDDDLVPYFLMPSLGSGSTLRGYSSWRFRDRHSLLLSGEWRWIPNRTFLDLAFFYDAGKVTSRREELNFSDLKHDAGIGIRFHSPFATPLRIDIARGGEGINLVFSGAAAF